MGYRLRMTIAFSLLVLAGMIVLTVLVLTSSYHEFKADRMMSVARMTDCLSGNLYWDVTADAPARVQESLERFSLGVPAPQPPLVVAIDRTGGFYAATDGGRRLAAGDPGVERLKALAHALDRKALPPQGALTIEQATGFVTAASIARDRQTLGLVLVDYPLSALQEHFLALFRAALGYGLLLLVILLLVGWALGKRLMRPISALRECMRRVGQGDLSVDCGTVNSRDEIGELARGFDEMLNGLREKRFLEQEMRQSERLAAVGQVSAGLAHEINNPLGGMLNALDTFRLHSEQPEMDRKTLDLLERGLRQIQTTVQALLVQARADAHPLTVRDLEDVRTLIQAEVHKKRLQLSWHCEVGEDALALPSSAVRQILINLLLNAIQAAPQQGRVALRCVAQRAHLWLRVEDDGPGVAEADQRKLFEPFFSQTGGHGLGLWVTYQTARQLGGSIEVMALAPGTAMEVHLPFSRRSSTNRTSENDR